MKNYLIISTLSIALLAPAGLAFADEGGYGAQGSAGAAINVAPLDVQMHADAGVQLQGGGQDDASKGDASLTDDDSLHSSTTPWASGEKEGPMMHTGTTMPPGVVRFEARASSTPAVFLGFWHWLMGLPATTTIGEIRADINASTTASSSAELPIPAKVGFFARLFGFFGLGGEK